MKCYAEIVLQKTPFTILQLQQASMTDISHIYESKIDNYTYLKLGDISPLKRVCYPLAVLVHYERWHLHI